MFVAVVTISFVNCIVVPSERHGFIWWKNAKALPTARLHDKRAIHDGGHVAHRNHNPDHQRCCKQDRGLPPMAPTKAAANRHSAPASTAVAGQGGGADLISAGVPTSAPINMQIKYLY